MQLRLLASYDMVGFSPRGTGASTRLICGSNELKRFVDPSPLALTDANLANAAYNDRKAAEACARNPLTAHITTDATARDMDLLRSLLGELLCILHPDALHLLDPWPRHADETPSFAAIAHGLTQVIATQRALVHLSIHSSSTATP